ncbi:hypothetical protein [Alicyclobacillus mengziensis]|uniref:Uncharacterized protein n=1 Tax=Alicyclobacillus mengziensis TaxID=2931921 RepID=A0A9X7W0I6_9BACL|nr:hypothetical protein [Alicyclobacillus mengziensis]QSO48461.1 hypothetical protein JZ786_05585 [Alicyclobacillus mengziensis]
MKRTGLAVILGWLISGVMVVANPQTASAIGRNQVQASKVQSELQLQQYVEQYINHRLAMLRAWNPPWTWAIYDFKVLGHESIGERDYVLGTCY